MVSGRIYPDSFTQWGSQESWPHFQSVMQELDTSGRPRSSSFAEVRSIDAVMDEFRKNGLDSPYDPEEEVNMYRYNKYTELCGMGPPGVYLRQKSWPAPEASPAVPAPAPRGFSHRSTEEVMPSSVPANMEEASPPQREVLTEYQIRVLNSLPNPVLYSLLRDLEQHRAQQHPRRVKQPEVVECRFCKNNGEKESFYRSHRLRWQGRVVCPVLRAYHCRRCGAQGDRAHTLKYCPLTTEDERMKSANMMRSIRQSSGRRRNWQAPSNDAAWYYGHVNPTVLRDGATYNMTEPLDPMWEDLARKLMI